MQWTITAYAATSRTCVVSRAVGFASRGIEGDREGMRRTDSLVRAIHFPRTLGEPCLCACWTLLWNTPGAPLVYYRQHGHVSLNAAFTIAVCLGIKVSALNSQR